MTDGDVPARADEPISVQSPALVLAEEGPTVVWDQSYPGAQQIGDPDVLEDWLEAVDQALVEARNGVTAISWPFALGGLLALLAILSDLIDAVGVVSLGELSGWIDLLEASPARLLTCVTLGVFTFAAFQLAGQGAEARRTLVALRAAYLRRRRQLGS